MELKLSRKELFVNVFCIVILIMLVGKLFYGTIMGGILIMPVSIIIFRQRKENIIKKKIDNYEIQFKDMLVSLSDGLTTGYSIENALKESYKDLLNIYGFDSDICRELRITISQMKLNVSVQKAIYEFAMRSNLKNAVLFAEIFSVVKRTGGDMTEIIKNVTEDIVRKTEIKEEILVSMNEKKLEQRVMTFIPMLIILYISISSPGFLNIVYETWAGKIIMTVCFALYLLAYIWGEKITTVHV